MRASCCQSVPLLIADADINQLGFTLTMDSTIGESVGLQVCQDTPVGNDMIRGISGGQKKRVTTGACLPSAPGGL